MAATQAGAHTARETVQIKPREARAALLITTGRCLHPPRRLRNLENGPNSGEKGAKMSKMAIKIEDLPALDATSVQVLRCIVLKLGGATRGRVEYKVIGKSIGKHRDVVAKAVKRLEEKRLLGIEYGELVLLNIVQVS